MKEKLTYISNARIIGILLVVFGHSYPLTGEIPLVFGMVRSFIYCFHMPLFVFISAYLVTKTESLERHGTTKYLSQRFIKLFVPYIGLSIIGFVPKVLLSQFVNDRVQFDILYFVKSILIPRDNVWGHLWFIPMLFSMVVLSVFYISILKNSNILAIILCIVVFGMIFIPDVTEWFGINDIKNYLFWYLSGLYLGNEKGLIKCQTIQIGSVCLFVGCVVFGLSGMEAYNPLVALFMVSGILLVCMNINLEKSKLLKEIGDYSFSIFLLSWPAQAVVEVIGNRILHVPLILNTIMMFLSGIFIPLLIVHVIKKIKKVWPTWKIEMLLGM